ncbi:hypothetical protein [Ruminococcus sp. Marseille-P6503]|uniref:hypothetical protein n=1 Tax=Ruminococcus sp. Marseille-P6503 TaxID=2364796 RepID=UPI000F526957|nr:hypothetical protein [Ruminococcus sp. Marseille-P6503]
MGYRKSAIKTSVFIQMLKAILWIGFIVYLLFTMLIFIENLPLEFLKTFRNWLLFSHTKTTLIVFLVTTICIFIPFVILITTQANEKINRLLSCQSDIKITSEENKETERLLEKYIDKLDSIDVSLKKQKENYDNVKNECCKLKNQAELNLYSSIDINDNLNKIASKNKHLAKTLGFKKAWQKYITSYKELYDK